MIVQPKAQCANNNSKEIVGAVYFNFLPRSDGGYSLALILSSPLAQMLKERTDELKDTIASDCVSKSCIVHHRHRAKDPSDLVLYVEYAGSVIVSMYEHLKRVVEKAIQGLLVGIQCKIESFRSTHQTRDPLRQFGLQDAI